MDFPNLVEVGVEVARLLAGLVDVRNLARVGLGRLVGLELRHLGVPEHRRLVASSASPTPTVSAAEQAGGKVVGPLVVPEVLAGAALYLWHRVSSSQRRLCSILLERLVRQVVQEMGVVEEVVEQGMLTFSLGVTLTVAQLLRKRVALVGAPSR
jgi:hypothetical protein